MPMLLNRTASVVMAVLGIWLLCLQLFGLLRLWCGCGCYCGRCCCGTAAVAAPQLLRLLQLRLGHMPHRCTASAPHYSAANCSEARDTLFNLMTHRVPKESDLFFFFSNFRLRNVDYTEIFKLHSAGRGHRDARQAACRWLKDNKDTWATWIKNTRQAPPANAVATRLAIIVLAAVLLLVALVAGTSFWHVTAAQRKIRRALQVQPSG